MSDNTGAEIVIRGPGKPILLLIHSLFKERKGRAWILKKLVNLFPAINRSSLNIRGNEFPLDLRNDAEIGYFYANGIEHEKFYKEVLEELVDGNTIFYDIGSNIGYYSFLLAQQVKAIYAFEPNPILYNRVTQAIKACRIKNINIYNLGLSEQKGNLIFYFNKSQHDLGSFIKSAFHTDSTEIEVSSLNDVIERENLFPPDILKIDVEGFEEHVLNGYTPDIKKPPILIVEWQGDDRELTLKEAVIQRWIKAGYNVYKIGHNNLLIPWEYKSYKSYSNLLFMPANHPSNLIIEKFFRAI